MNTIYIGVDFHARQQTICYLPQKLDSGRTAPKARNMIARGKRRARRGASPLDNKNKFGASTESAKYQSLYSALSELAVIGPLAQGRRASLCSALAPGYHISRLWRCAA